jgi:hypothetical protein
MLAMVAGALGATAAGAASVPPIQCDPVSCIEPIERKLDGVQQCVDGAVTAIRYVLQGTPQPQVCTT